MKILYIEDHSLEDYSYYSEIHDALSAHKEITEFYKTNSYHIDKVIKKIKFIPDAIVFGFGSTDIGQKKLKKIKVNKFRNIPKIIILNKEYTRLEEKLEWIKENNFILAFSIHKDIKEFEKISNTKFVDLKFAVNENKFYKVNVNYKYDLGFTGIIRPEQDKDIRRRFIDEIRNNTNLSSLKIFWNDNTFLSQDEYLKKICESKVWFTSTGPGDLIGTRYYEVMATGTTALISNFKNGIFDNLFLDEEHLCFFKNINEVEPKLSKLINDEDYRQRIIKNAKNNVLQNHTWKHRADYIIKNIKVVL